MFGFTVFGVKVGSKGVDGRIDFSSRIDSNIKIEFDVFASTIISKRSQFTFSSLLI